MYDFKTLPEALNAAAETQASITFVNSADSQVEVPIRELRMGALGLLGRMQRHGIQPGDELIVHVADNRGFLEAFWGCLLGGIVPVPLAVGISEEHRMKVVRIFRRLRNPTLYTDGATLARLEQAGAPDGGFADVSSRALLVEGESGDPGLPTDVQPGDLAFVQFSSGSTSEPKGVTLTHDNVVTNVRAIIAGGNMGPEDRLLSWMPLSHDMGMIGFHLVPMLLAVDSVLIPADLFVRRPSVWMTKASEFRATVLCSPNFGYKHFLKGLERRDPGPLDLSSVRVIFNGAEPISVGLSAEFTDRLSAFGLTPSSMYFVYGLAEASVAVSIPEVGGAAAVHVKRTSVVPGQAVEFTEADAPGSIPFAVVGRPVQDCEVRVTADDGSTLPDDAVGHVEIRGRNVTSGYYRDEEATRAATRPDGWVATGDMGFLGQSGLVITGRHKDIIFSNGQNFFPHDLETILQREAGLDLGKVAVAGHRDPDADADDVLVFVVHKGDLAQLLPVAGRIIATLNAQMGVDVTHVVPIGRIPKTTSGKAQRARLLQGFADGEFAGPLAEMEALRAEAAGTDAGGQDSEDGKDASIATRLLDLCRGLLPARSVGLDDNLFEIGTSSLELAQIHEGIEKAFPGAVDITDLFDYPTIGELTAFLESKLGAS